MSEAPDINTPAKATETSARTLSLGREMATLLALSTVLGVCYNQASPLGIRAARTSPVVMPAAAPGQGLATPLLRSAYSNETVAFSLELASATQPPPSEKASTMPVADGAPPYRPALDPDILAMSKNGLPSLTWAQVKALLPTKRIVLLDARPKSRYDVSHIPGALSLPTTATLEELLAFATAYPKDTALVTYCSSDQCHLSAQLAEALIKVCGFTNVSDMPGGYAEYVSVESRAGANP